MSGERFSLFCCAPGSSEQAIHIGSKHRGGVIEREERVKASALKLTLANHATAPAFVAKMLSARKDPTNQRRVVRVLVGFDDDVAL